MDCAKDEPLARSSAACGRSIFCFSLFSLLVVAIDQLTKYAIRHALPEGTAREVVANFFDICHVRNIGAAWGILPGQRIALISAAIIALFAIVYSLVIKGERRTRAAAILLTGGIIGNTIDRAVFGFVTDFLDFHWGVYHFPAFNVADAAICVGVALYIIWQLWSSSPESSSAQPPSEKAP